MTAIVETRSRGAHSVLVIGGGVAGLAAAWAARRAGKAVTLVDRGAGASVLGGGAVDDEPWERRWRRTAGVPSGESALARAHVEPPPDPLPAEVEAFVRDLGLWTMPEGRAPRLVTLAGRVRLARAHDAALLDLGAIPGARVLLPRAPRAAWDADALAAALNEDPLAQALSLRFAASDTAVLRHDDERRIGDADLAARHDQPARVEWLAERLREAAARAGVDRVAVLLGPWLGAAAPRAAEVAERAGLPVGEALLGVGGPAGLRFAAARGRMLELLGVEVVRARAAAVVRHGERMRVELEAGSALSADVVIVAVGGVAGGGIAYAPPELTAGSDFPPNAAAPFQLSLRTPLSLGVRGEPAGVISSLHGPDLDVTGWPDHDESGVLEAIGVRSKNGAPVSPGIHVAGDVVADRPRTLLEAAASGIAAGREA